jgi:hypothetical protein
MPILSNDTYDADVVNDLQDFAPVLPYEAEQIIERAEGLENVNTKIRKHLNRAGGTSRNAARTLVDLMCNGKDNVRLNAAVKVLELHGAEFKTASAQPTLQVVVSSNNVNLGAIFNPRRQNGGS